uniref:Protein kinase domain-containing protein n=1 Tax=Arcella intermedia TaxID=1963864 RepID=A0A6B2KYP4_9EUKA
MVLSTKLGSGTFGTVYKGSCRGNVVAIKVLKVTAMNLEDILLEVGMMSHLRFQNIVTMHGVSFDDNHLYIISEYLPCGDLEHWLMDKDKEISFITKLKILKDVAMGMNWLHASDPPVIHRDLKPANVLLTTSRRPGDEETLIKEKRTKEIEKDLMAKVTDMGLSKIMTIKQLKADGAGSNLWMAPELLKYQYYDEKVDVYSFSLLIWQVLTWTRNPYQDYLDRGDLDVFVEAVYYRRVRPEIPKGTHPRLVSLIQAGWAHQAKERPHFSEIVPVLDDCLVSTLFKDERYAIFWQRNWGARKLQKEERVEPAKEVVPFTVFAQAFYDYLSHFGVHYPINPESDVYYLCLKVMLVDPKFDAVTLDRLQLIEKWFGPLIDDNFMTSPRLSKTPRKSSQSKSSTTINVPLNLGNVKKEPSSPSLPRSPSTTVESPRKLKKDVVERIDRDKDKIRPNSARKHPSTLESPRNPHMELSGRKSFDRNEINSKTPSSPSFDQDFRSFRSYSKTEAPSSVSKNNSRPSVPRFNIGKERPEERTLLGTLKRTLEQQWFHGDISKENADSTVATSRMQESRGNIMLEASKLFSNSTPTGDFLIRLSLSEPIEKHPFTITKVDKKGVIFHQRIFYDEETKLYKVFTKNNGLPEVSADSLHGLVKQLVDAQMIHRPCKRWNYARKYDDIFQQKEVHDKGYLDGGYLDFQ